MSLRLTALRRLLVSLAIALQSSTAFAGIHTWDINEVFTNADGTIQFVELWEANGTPGETGVGTGTMTSNTESFPIGGVAVPPPTTNKFYLLGTAAFALLPGAPIPDAIIPAGSVPFFSSGGDTVSFGAFDSWAFGTVPTNGTDSLDRFAGVGPNTPTNYLGMSGFVDASPPPPGVPSISIWGITLMAALLLGASAFAIRKPVRSTP